MKRNIHTALSLNKNVVDWAADAIDVAAAQEKAVLQVRQETEVFVVAAPLEALGSTSSIDLASIEFANSEYKYWLVVAEAE